MSRCVAAEFASGRPAIVLQSNVKMSDGALSQLGVCWLRPPCIEAESLTNTGGGTLFLARAFASVAHASRRLQAAYQSSKDCGAHGTADAATRKLLRNAQRERLLAAVAVAALAQFSPGRPMLEPQAQAEILRRMRDALAALEAQAGVQELGTWHRNRELKKQIDRTRTLEASSPADE